MSELLKLTDALKQAYGIEQTEFDRLNKIELSDVPNLGLTSLVVLSVFKEKKNRGQKLDVEIKLNRQFESNTTPEEMERRHKELCQC